MKYDVISADCHVDLIWLPRDLFTANASAAFKERMPYVADGPRGREWVTKNGASFGLDCGMGSAGRLYEPGKIHRSDRMASTGLYDPEQQKIRRLTNPNLRRYFAYLEHSIDKGTQWAVFEPNGELLWGNVRRTIEDFLLNEWQMGALLGDKPEKAYFVRCDRSTMTQNDLDNGRLVCLIGVAPLRPAEFVIFRIGQWTGDRKV